MKSLNTAKGGIFKGTFPIPDVSKYAKTYIKQTVSKIATQVNLTKHVLFSKTGHMEDYSAFSG